MKVSLPVRLGNRVESMGKKWVYGGKLNHVLNPSGISSRGSLGKVKAGV